mgnify:FL=1
MMKSEWTNLNQLEPNVKWANQVSSERTVSEPSEPWANQVSSEWTKVSQLEPTVSHANKPEPEIENSESRLKSL